MLRVPPFKAREFVGRFSDAHMHKAFRLFADTDGKLKGASATAPARLLEALGLELCRLAEPPRPKGASQATGSRQAGRAEMTPEQSTATRMIRSGPPTGR
jgi:hypothetical protein